MCFRRLCLVFRFYNSVKSRMNGIYFVNPFCLLFYLGEGGIFYFYVWFLIDCLCTALQFSLSL